MPLQIIRLDNAGKLTEPREVATKVQDCESWESYLICNIEPEDDLSCFKDELENGLPVADPVKVAAKAAATAAQVELDDKPGLVLEAKVLITDPASDSLTDLEKYIVFGTGPVPTNADIQAYIDSN